MLKIPDETIFDNMGLKTEIIDVLINVIFTLDSFDFLNHSFP